MKDSVKFKLRIIFTIYCAIMIYLLFGQRILWVQFHNYIEQLKSSYNIIPFKTIKDFMRVLENNSNPTRIYHAVVNLIGNVAMFVPLGFLLPCMWEKLRKFIRFIGYVIGIVLLIEVTQFTTLLGSLDIDDFILNTIGAIIGFIIFKIVLTINGKHKTIT